MLFFKIYRRRRKRVKTAHEKLSFNTHRNDARAQIRARLDYWSAICGYSYNKVCIRDQRSRWGSCSARKNLNFNYRIIFLPQELMDYVIVHELCHLEELNHSAQFWNLVGKYLPEYEQHRKELLRISMHDMVPKKEKSEV